MLQANHMSSEILSRMEQEYFLFFACTQDVAHCEQACLTTSSHIKNNVITIKVSCTDLIEMKMKLSKSSL